jgi:hypothetical protein
VKVSLRTDVRESPKALPALDTHQDGGTQRDLIRANEPQPSFADIADPSGSDASAPVRTLPSELDLTVERTAVESAALLPDQL